MGASDPGVIDGDGHVFEDLDAIRGFLPFGWRDNVATRALGLFPTLDHMHHALSRSPEGAFTDVGARGWAQFLEETAVSSSVLYPTRGLVCGRIVDLDYAIGLTRAYNDWLHEAYLRANPALQGMALIPMQEPAAAVEELGRAVHELGMRGAMIPSNGLKAHLGSREYWPVYREAERLGCALAVHGGCHDGLGFDDLNVFAAIHALGHPLGILIGFAAMVSNGVFERFPGLRVGFLEGGVAWFVFVLERLSGSFDGFVPHDPRGEYLRLQLGERVTDRVLRHVEAGRIYVGIEGDEPSLGDAVRRFGPGAFFFSSDFPHEVNAAICRERIAMIRTHPELSPADRQAILRDNAARLYALPA